MKSCLAIEPFLKHQEGSDQSRRLYMLQQLIQLEAAASYRLLITLNRNIPRLDRNLCLTETVIRVRTVRFEVLTAVVMNSTIVWDVTPCSPMNVNRGYGRTSPPSSGSKNKPRKKPA
jgi:hypothetical protein